MPAFGKKKGIKKIRAEISETQASKTAGKKKKMKEKKSPYPDVFTGEFSEIFKEYVLIFLKLFQKLKIREHF